jgi:hypothetical protein
MGIGRGHFRGWCILLSMYTNRAKTEGSIALRRNTVLLPAGMGYEYVPYEEPDRRSHLGRAAVFAMGNRSEKPIGRVCHHQRILTEFDRYDFHRPVYAARRVALQGICRGLFRSVSSYLPGHAAPAKRPNRSIVEDDRCVELAIGAVHGAVLSRLFVAFFGGPDKQCSRVLCNRTGS